MRVANALTGKARRSRAVSRLGIATVVLIGGCALQGGVSTVLAQTADPVAEAGTIPAICVEAEAGALDPGVWAEVLGAIEMAIDREPDLFPEATVVSVPDLTTSWRTADNPTVRIGIWATAEKAPVSAESRQHGLVATDCLTDGTTWTMTISRQVLQAGAERILAEARLPDESGSPPVREDAGATITVEFDPANARVRTTLQFNVPLGPFRPGGTCWIDDTLSLDVATGTLATSTSTGMRVDPLMDSGCAKFQAFMTKGGAGEQALSLIPLAIPLADGTTARLAATSVNVTAEAIVMAGAVRWPSDS